MKRNKKLNNGLGGRFVGLPHWLLQHSAFRAASHRARALLIDVALQYNGSNNGKLVVCEKALKPLGWNSKDGLQKAKKELLALELLTETRKGARPNKAAWYALSWRPLDVIDGLDINPRSYLTLAARKIEVGSPTHGVKARKVGPAAGVKDMPSTPHGGPIDRKVTTTATPSSGVYVDVAIPSTKLEDAVRD